MTPHPLDGPKLKVISASKQIESLQDESKRFFDQDLYRVRVAELNRKTGLYVLRIRETPPIPTTWSIFIGEIAHNLRSALDGLICQLAIRANPGSDWRLCESKRTGFPIFIVGPHSRRRPRFNRNMLSYFRRRPAYTARIEALQPYKRGNGYRTSPLWLLHELNNTDKHRLIPVVDGRLRGSSLVPIKFDPAAVRLKSGVWLKPNAKIGEVYPKPSEPEMEVYIALFPEIAFGEGCDAVERLPVIRTLIRMANRVHDIIKSFADEFP